MKQDQGMYVPSRIYSIGTSRELATAVSVHTDPVTELTGDGELELRTEHVPARDVGHRRVQSAELLLHTHLQRAPVQQRLLQPDVNM